MDLYNIFLDQKDDFLADLKQFLQIKSVSSDKKSLDLAVDFLYNLAKKFNLEAFIHFDKEVITIELGESEEIFGILAHLDVVPVAEEEWNVPPFDLTLIDNILYGRGVVDDKGPIIMILYVLKILKENNIKLTKKIQLIVGTQEEVAWTDMKKYVASNKLPSFGFTPDGSFPVQNAEKGYIDLKLTFPKYNIEDIKGGVATNSIPSDFYCKINNTEYFANGVTTHSSRPNEGVNAIFKGIKDIKETNKVFEFIEKYLFDYLGKDLGIYKETYVNDNIINETTQALTMINLVNDKIELVINYRTALDETYKTVLEKFQALKKDYDFEIEVLEYMKPVYVDKNTDFINILKNSYDTITETKSEFSLATCATYAKAIDNFVSFGPLFPWSKYTLHQSNEEFILDELLLAQKIYFNVIYKICS